MKKIVSLCVVFSMVLACAVPSLAAESDSKDLEKAILTVKQIIDIPDTYSEFSYYTYRERDEKGNIWSLTWNDTKNDSTITATVDWLGNLISYFKYEYKGETGLGNVSREEAKKNAEQFLNKVIPALAKDMKEISFDRNYSSGNTHNFLFRLFVNDIPVSFVNTSVNVDKYTGEVISYSGFQMGLEKPEFPSLDDNLIDLDVAKQAYLDEIGVSLKYYSHYDYQNRQLNIYPAYRLDYTNKVIDAKTGKAINLYREDFARTSEDAAAGGMGSSELSKQELEAIEKLEGLLTQKEAADKIISQVPFITKSMQIVGASLYQDMIDKNLFIWSLNFDDGVYGSVNAKTGELLNFSYYESLDKGNRKLSKERAKDIAETFLRKVAAEKFAESKYAEEEPEYIIYPENNEITRYTFRYNRQVNGIDFVDNGLYVTVNLKTGNINYYYNRWYSNAEFPSIDKVITEKEIMDIMANDGVYALRYAKTENGDVGLVYDFEAAYKGAIYNPFNGERINYDGKPYRSVIRPAYTDIEGHWSKDIVLELVDNGYFLEGDRFNPDQNITQLNFFRYLYTPESRYYDDEGLYRMLENMGIIKEGEKAPERALMREEAAKFAIRYLGLDLAAKNSEIFVNKFKDHISDEYKGYIALCYGLDIMKGDEKGNFNGKKVLTNAEAAVTIYNMLKVK